MLDLGERSGDHLRSTGETGRLQGSGVVIDYYEGDCRSNREVRNVLWLETVYIVIIPGRVNSPTDQLANTDARAS